MSIFTLPPIVPADAILGDGYALQWYGPLPDQDCVEVQFSTPIDGVLASGYGATPADAMCGLLSAFPDSDEVRLPACVAAALDELAHQAVRVVCQRLSGGTIDEATFAEPVSEETQSGQVEEEDIFEAALIQILQRSKPVIGLYDEKTLNNIEQKFLKLLAEEEPDHPWVLKALTPREGDHPRSKEFVRR